MDNAIQQLTSADALSTKTFILVGAGAAQSDSYTENLRLPLAQALRDKLLVAHYGNIEIDECIQKFEKEFEIEKPSSDQVWQMLIKSVTNLRNHAERLYLEFSSEKPIPPSYHMLARWFFTPNISIGGIATTNFDLQFSKAFENVATSLNKRKTIDYNIADLAQDFHYFDTCDKPIKSVIQMLHGSLVRPWSIVAGSKENIHDMLHYLHGILKPLEDNPFEIIRQIVYYFDKKSKGHVDQIFFPYQYLQKSLEKSDTIIIIGYSFNDKELVRSIDKGCGKGKIYVIDPNPDEKRIHNIKSLANAHIIKGKAEDFLRKYIRHLHSEESLIQLPSRERRILRDGPQNIPGYDPGENMPKSDGKSGIESEFIDPIYGKFFFSKEISNDILKLIDTGEVQRLRQIKQLSFVNLKYHGATHDRFSHSLGVAYLADILINYWKGNNIDKLYKEIAHADHLSFLTAALIHDIGHGPLGHTMDLVRYKLKDAKGHEADTTKIFEQIFAEDSFADLDKALSNLKIARDDVISILGRSEKKQSRHSLHSIINNSGCDIDRLDFVLRDAASTLLIRGSSDRTDSIIKRHFENLITNYNRILQGVRFFRKNGESVLAYDKTVENYMESFAYLYLKLYDDVYYCWQNISARSMIAEAVVEMVNSGKLKFSDIKPLTDVELIATLEEFEHPKVSELAYLVKYRHLYRLVYEIKISDDEARKMELISDAEIIEKYQEDYSEIKKDGLLVARLPSKKVEVNFVSTTELSNNEEGGLLTDRIQSSNMGCISARIMIFRPPAPWHR